MSDWGGTIAALVIGGVLGLIMGAGMSGDITRDWLKAGAFEFGGVAYKVERLVPPVAACTHHPVLEASK